MSRFDDPAFVRRQYATEDGLRARVAAYEGVKPDPRELVVELLRDEAPRRLLEVGCGWGELAQWIQQDVGCEVVVTDQSERMVELARERGLDARVADVLALPFADGEFDAAVAAWVLFHVSDVDSALAGLARVLRRGGTLVAVTNSVHDLRELWRSVGRGPLDLTFRAENGVDLLARHFASVERHDVTPLVAFADAEAVRRHVGSSEIGREYLGAVRDELDAPLVAMKRVSVFVARKAA